MHMLSLLLVCALRVYVFCVIYSSLALLITFRENYYVTKFCLKLIALKLHEVSNQLSHFKTCSNTIDSAQLLHVFIARVNSCE